MLGAETHAYLTTGDTTLNMYVYKPDDFSADKQYPAIIFFFGGGWSSGSPEQFVEQSRYLASRGMVALVADYRVRTRQKVNVTDCVMDAKAAIRWTRANASTLGIDPGRIVAAGGSAGGHLAACTGLVPGFEHAEQDEAVSSKPNALVLFNPVLMLASFGDVEMDAERTAVLRQRIGTENSNVSPVHHVSKSAPPTIIFHGTKDTTVPIDTIIAFEKAMLEAGNVCTLVQYRGMGHGFFNSNRGDKGRYAETVQAMDDFLVGLDYLSEESASAPE